MSEDLTTDDQSHYEISLTAGQAFLAFVLLLLSLAASFAFGLMIGKGQADERLVVRKEPAVIQEGSSSASKKGSDGRIVDLGVPSDEFKAPATTTQPKPGAEVSVAPPVINEGTTAAPPATKTTEPPPAVAQPTTSARPVIEASKPPAATAKPAVTAPGVPYFAQLLSTGDQKTAEALAAKLINGGFTSAYVAPSITDKGVIFRVRVPFPSEAAARAAEVKLHEYSKEVWITR